MTRLLAAGLFVAGLTLGTLAPVPRRPAVDPTAQGEHVLMADLHVHSFLGDGALAPWEVVREARRRGLDAIAVTNHNQVFSARVARWFSRRIGGPIVLVGDEVTAPGYHIAAVGITRAIDWRLSSADAVAAIHAQGGVAIAAHPRARYWAGLESAVTALDGSEVAHPLVEASEEGRRELRAFYGRLARRSRPTSAIGSSDFHVLSALGLHRTRVFVRERSEAGVLEALRRGRTAVVDDRELVRTPLEAVGAACALIGLMGLITFAREG